MKFSTQNLLSIREWQTHAEVYQQALDQAAIVGDAAEVADKVRMHRETLGVTHLMGAFARGGVPHDAVTRSMRLFAEKVMPRVV